MRPWKHGDGRRRRLESPAHVSDSAAAWWREELRRERARDSWHERLSRSVEVPCPQCGVEWTTGSSTYCGSCDPGNPEEIRAQSMTVVVVTDESNREFLPTSERRAPDLATCLGSWATPANSNSDASAIQERMIADATRARVLGYEPSPFARVKGERGYVAMKRWLMRHDLRAAAVLTDAEIERCLTQFCETPITETPLWKLKLDAAFERARRVHKDRQCAREKRERIARAEENRAAWNRDRRQIMELRAAHVAGRSGS